MEAVFVEVVMGLVMVVTMDEPRISILMGAMARIIDDTTRAEAEAEAAADLVGMTTALRLPAKLLRPGRRAPRSTR